MIHIKDHLKSQPTTEGYYTIKAVKKISEKNNVNMPIMKSIYDILYNEADIKNKINELLERPLKTEFE